MQYLITLSGFNKFSDKALKPLAFLSAIFLLIGLYYSLILSPPDYQQGEAVRIMYIHVPSAWLSLGTYFGLTLSSISFLIWRNPLSAIFVKAMIPIGAVFCLICLLTGAIWGKPIWGVFWVWDARLTSVLILFFMYIGLLLLFNAFDSEERAMRSVAILAIIGSINLPIIRFSVKWWNTLHQPASIMRMDKPALHQDMLIPLILMSLAFLLIFATTLILSAKTEINKKKAKRIEI